MELSVEREKLKELLEEIEQKEKRLDNIIKNLGEGLIIFDEKALL